MVSCQLDLTVQIPTRPQIDIDNCHRSTAEGAGVWSILCVLTMTRRAALHATKIALTGCRMRSRAITELFQICKLLASSSFTYRGVPVRDIHIDQESRPRKVCCCQILHIQHLPKCPPTISTSVPQHHACFPSAPLAKWYR